MTPSTKTDTNLGRITQIIGPVIDVAFAPEKMPNIYNALTVEGKTESGETLRIVAEVQQLLGDNLVRAVSMSATDGLMRGMTVVDTGAALSVPVLPPPGSEPEVCSGLDFPPSRACAARETAIAANRARCSAAHAMASSL